MEPATNLPILSTLSQRYPATAIAAGMCDAPIDISAFAESKIKTSNRLWSQKDVQWLLPVAASVLALLLKLCLVHAEQESSSIVDPGSKEVVQAGL